MELFLSLVTIIKMEGSDHSKFQSMATCTSHVAKIATGLLPLLMSEWGHPPPALQPGSLAAGCF
jgi:hypothetical protein